jgi:hypothetical protein
MARGTFLGFRQPDENEPWTIHIQLRVPAEEEDESAPVAEPVDGDEPPDDDS